MLACALMSSGDYGMFVSIEPGGYGTIWLLWSGRPAGMGKHHGAGLRSVFAQVLERYFPGQVQPSAYLPIPDFPHPYTTDCTLEVDGLHIDIEIDEPYVWKTKEPHHCVDDFRDERRDQFFMERGWVVIRFSEKQVVTQPDACCGVIARTIAILRGPPLPDWARWVGALQEDPRWTIEQARIYAQQDYRRSYIRVPRPRLQSSGMST
jgi:hypothetical protein